MIESKTITAEEEKALLQEWFETVRFDEEFDELPALEPEKDDEESRSVLESIEFDDLLEELRKRDPENPF
jgi:hypothetical protein